MRSLNEFLKILHPWSANYFTNRKGSSYSPTERCIDYRELSLALPRKTAFVYFAVSNEKILRSWVYSYKTTIVKTGTLPEYLYSNKISKVAETTETYSADLVRSSDIEKEVLKRD